MPRRRALSAWLAVLLLAAPHAARAVTLLEPLAPSSVPGGANTVRLSPDGKHAYTARGNSITRYARDIGTGVLTFVEVQPTSLGFGRDVLALSPDGAHVYVAGYDRVSVFARNAVTGALTFVEWQIDDVGGVDGLGDARAVVASPDGAHVYAVSASDDAVAVFSRNAGTGALTFVEMEQNGVAGVDGLDGATQVIVSPDGGHVYVASIEDDAVAVFARNAGTGALTFVEADVHPSLDQPLSLAASPDGEHLYVPSSQSDALLVFDRNPGTGALTFVEAQVYGMGGVVGLLGPNAVGVSPDGAHVYVDSFPAIVIFSRNAVTGALTFVATEVDDVLTPLGGLDFTADGAYVFVAYLSGIATLARNAGTGLLALVDQKTKVPGGVTVLTMSPDGAHVYAAAPTGDAVEVYARESTTGALTYVEAYVDDKFGLNGIGFPSDLAVSADGAHLYVVGSFDNAVTVFARNVSTGKLTFVESQVEGVGGVDGLENVSAVALSADGAHLYAASAQFEHAVAVFARNAGTGGLTFVEVQKNGVGGVEGLLGANLVAVSPDGAHVYAGGNTEDAIVTFARNAGTGALTFQSVVRDDLGGVRGLTFMTDLEVSPDGQNVYAVGLADDAFVNFQRDGGTGNLTLLEVETADRRGIANIEPGGFAVSPDGLGLYGVGELVGVFARELPKGTLAYTEAEPTASVTLDAVVSPDSRHLYATTGSVVGFAVTPAGCTAAPIAPCRDAGRNVLVVGDRTPNDRRDSIVWRWLQGDTTLPGDFGSPATTNDYALCAYDPALVFEAFAPAGGNCDAGASSRPCWTISGSTVRYRDGFRTPGGLLMMKLVSGGAGAAQIVVRGGGEDLRTPTLPLALPLRVQLQSKAGECWQSLFTAAALNTAARFRATAD